MQTLFTALSLQKERPIAHEKFVSQKIAHRRKNEREKGAFVLAIDGFLEG